MRTAFFEVPKNFFIFRCCLIHLNNLCVASHNFFKWIKQRLHIKSFYGTSQNAVFSQIWIAICDYLLLAIAKKVYHVDQDLYILSAAIGKVLFERKPLAELFVKPKRPQKEYGYGQLTLWENFFGQ